MKSRYVAAVLFVVTVFNFIDRQILPILLESIKRELQASDSEMGLLTGFAFVIFFALAGVPIARVADRRSRRNIIARSLAFWSVMTMLTGYATSFIQLGIARAGLGIGEAATAPAAQSMLSDLFAADRRTSALSLLAAAGPIGVMLAFIVGGWLEQVVGWRMTFVIVGAPGLLLALLITLTVGEPRRGAAEAASFHATPVRYGFLETVAYLWSLRSLRYMTAGASLSFFSAWALVVWSAPFLIRVHGMETAAAGAWVGIASGVGGIAGTFCGGLVGQRLAFGDAARQLRMSAVTSALTVPFVILFLTLPSLPARLTYLGGAFFGSFMNGPVLAITQGLAKIEMRAFAASVVALTFNVIGTGFGPLTVGVLSDALASRFGDASIRFALLGPTSLALLGAALCFALGAAHVRTDLQQATQGKPSSEHT